jgi:hypothetical protein
MTSPDPRLHSPFCPRGWPPGRRRLDVWTERGSFPVWGWFTLPAPSSDHSAREVHGNLGPATLGLSAGLAGGLRDWAHHYDAGLDPGERPAWRDRGRELADRLAAETGALVVYRWPADGHDPSCPDCQP